MEEKHYSLGKRTQVQEKNDYVRIAIKMKPNFFIAFFSLLIFAFAGSVTATVALNVKWDFFLVLWMVGFATASLFTAYVFIWNFFGIEEIHLFPSRLVFERKLFSLKVRRAVFDVNKIKNVRIPKESEIVPSKDYSVDWFEISGGNVAFDYDDDIYTFGIELKKQEARRIIDIIQNTRLENGSF